MDPGNTGQEKVPKKAPKSPGNQSPDKTRKNKSSEEKEKENSNTKTEKKIEVSTTKTEKTKKRKTNVLEVSHEEMDTSTNLKRRGDSGDAITEGEEKKK